MFITDVLPLVPFELEEGISDEEALTLINMDTSGDEEKLERTLSNTHAAAEAKEASTLTDGNASHEDHNNEGRNGFLRIGSESDGKNANCTHKH